MHKIHISSITKKEIHKYIPTVRNYTDSVPCTSSIWKGVQIAKCLLDIRYLSLKMESGTQVQIIKKTAWN